MFSGFSRKNADRKTEIEWQGKSCLKDWKVAPGNRFTFRFKFSANLNSSHSEDVHILFKMISAAFFPASIAGATPPRLKDQCPTVYKFFIGVLIEPPKNPL